MRGRGGGGGWLLQLAHSSQQASGDTQWLLTTWWECRCAGGNRWYLTEHGWQWAAGGQRHGGYCDRFSVLNAKPNGGPLSGPSLDRAAQGWAWDHHRALS